MALSKFNMLCTHLLYRLLHSVSKQKSCIHSCRHPDSARCPRLASSSGGFQKLCSGARDTWLFLCMQTGEHWYHQEASQCLRPSPPDHSMHFLLPGLQPPPEHSSPFLCPSARRPPDLKTPDNANPFCTKSPLS